MEMINQFLDLYLDNSFGRFLLSILMLYMLRFAIVKWYQISKSRRKPDNFIFGINNVFRAFLFFAIIVFLFSLFGIDLKSLITSLSIVAAALVLIFREYISDFLFGLYFGFSKDFEIGDYILSNDIKGKVVELTLFKTKLLNDDDDLISIPNGKIFNNELINYTKRDFRLLSIDFQINIDKVKSLEDLEDELVKSLEDYFEFLELESFNLKIVKMEKDSIDLKFMYQLKRFDQNKMKEIRKKTVRCVLNYISKV